MKKLFAFLFSTLILFSCRKNQDVHTIVEGTVVDDMLGQPMNGALVVINNSFGGGNTLFFGNVPSSGGGVYDQMFLDSTGKFKFEFDAPGDSDPVYLEVSLKRPLDYYTYPSGRKIELGQINKFTHKVETAALYYLELSKNSSRPNVDSFKFYLSNENKPLIAFYRSDTLSFGKDNTGNIRLINPNHGGEFGLAVFHLPYVKGNTMVKRVYGFKPRGGVWQMQEDSVFCKMFQQRRDTIFY
jgi:hypothetical protein